LSAHFERVRRIGYGSTTEIRAALLTFRKKTCGVHFHTILVGQLREIIIMRVFPDASLLRELNTGTRNLDGRATRELIIHPKVPRIDPCGDIRDIADSMDVTGVLMPVYRMLQTIYVEAA
jgi:hypothetical protein